MGSGKSGKRGCLTRNHQKCGVKGKAIVFHASKTAGVWGSEGELPSHEREGFVWINEEKCIKKTL